MASTRIILINEMAPNRRGSPAQPKGSVIKPAEVEARGRGTEEDTDSYDSNKR